MQAGGQLGGQQQIPGHFGFQNPDSVAYLVPQIPISILIIVRSTVLGYAYTLDCDRLGQEARSGSMVD